MRKALIIAASVLIWPMVSVQAQTQPASPSQQVSAAEQQALEDLFEAMDMAALGVTYANRFLGQVEQLIGSTGVSNKPLAMQIIEEETRAVVEENQFSLMMKLYPVYARHFNEEELAELTAFYQTPTGQKAVMLMPQLMTETMSAGQGWAMSLAPTIMQRVINRMSEVQPSQSPAEPVPPPQSKP